MSDEVFQENICVRVERLEGRVAKLTGSAGTLQRLATLEAQVGALARGPHLDDELVSQAVGKADNKWLREELAKVMASRETLQAHVSDLEARCRMAEEARRAAEKRLAGVCLGAEEPLLSNADIRALQHSILELEKAVALGQEEVDSDMKLLRSLLDALGNHVEPNESALDTLHRLLADRNAARDALVEIQAVADKGLDP